MGKRLKNIFTENDLSKSYSLDEAVDIAIKTATTKFNETIDICMNLNIDPKNGEQNVRGKIKLPKSLGKNVKVCVFASCLLYTSPSPLDRFLSRMPSSA